MGARRNSAITQQSGNAPRFGPEIEDGDRVPEMAHRRVSDAEPTHCHPETVVWFPDAAEQATRAVVAAASSCLSILGHCADGPNQGGS